MHKFNTNGVAIGIANNGKNLTQSGDLTPQYEINKNRAIHVSISETIGRRIKFRMRNFRAKIKRIKISHQMAANTIGTNEHNSTDRIQRCCSDILAII